MRASLFSLLAFLFGLGAAWQESGWMFFLGCLGGLTTVMAAYDSQEKS